MSTPANLTRDEHFDEAIRLLEEAAGHVRAIREDAEPWCKLLVAGVEEHVHHAASKVRTGKMVLGQ